MKPLKKLSVTPPVKWSRTGVEILLLRNQEVPRPRTVPKKGRQW